MANARYDAPDPDAFQPFAISRRRRVARRRPQAESKGAGVSVGVDGVSAPGSDVAARVSAARCRGHQLCLRPSPPSPARLLAERWQMHVMTPMTLAHSSHLPSLAVDGCPGVDPRPSRKVRVCRLGWISRVGLTTAGRIEGGGWTAPGPDAAVRSSPKPCQRRGAAATSSAFARRLPLRLPSSPRDGKCTVRRP